MATSSYNKFGRLINIIGNSSTTYTAAWTNYKTSATSGNVVFADLTGGAEPGGTRPAGMYIYANSIEYKVADIVAFNKLKAEFDQFVIDANASISDISADRNELERWRQHLTFNLASNKIQILDGSNKGILGDVTVTGGEYVNITTPASGANGTLNVSIVNTMIERSTASGRDAGAYRKLTTKGYVDTSIDTVNSSISNISTRVSNAITQIRTVATGKYNDVSIGTYHALDDHNTQTGWVLDTTYHIKGDGNYIITNGGAENADVTITLGVNTAGNLIDGGAKDASISTTGAIRDYVNRRISNLEGAIRLIGEVDTSANMHTILTGVDASKGNMWIATGAFEFTSNNPAQSPKTVRIENGDQIVITTSQAAGTVDASFLVVERNLDGAVTAGYDTLVANQVIVGNGNQTVKHTDYTLGTDTDSSTNWNGTSNKLATEKAVRTYVEGQFDKLDIAVNSSNNTYFHIKKTKNRTNLSQFETIEAGVGTATYAGATAAATTGTAGTTLADANSFKKAISSIGAAVGLTDGTDSFDPNWNSTIQTHLNIGQSNDVVDTIEKLDASVTLYINKMEVPNTDTANRILVGIEQHKGVVSNTSAILKINGVNYTHTKGDGIVTATIDGTNIKVGGTTTQWKDSSINKAIEDISNGFVSRVVGESKFTAVSGTTIKADYVRVESNKTSTNNNTYTLNTSLRLTNHPTVQSTDYVSATDTGLATDGYVKDYVHSILEWETIS